MSRPTVAERFWARVDRRGPNDCWEWKGARYRAGYGRIAVNGRDEYAHRVSVILDGRSLGPGQLACHHCDNKPCVNPAHLYVGTHTSNRLDAYRRGQMVAHPPDGAAVSAFFRAYWREHPERHPQGGKTHCPRGHEYTPENTYVEPKGGRHCRICGRVKAAAWMRQQRAHAATAVVQREGVK